MVQRMQCTFPATSSAKQNTGIFRNPSSWTVSMTDGGHVVRSVCRDRRTTSVCLQQLKKRLLARRFIHDSGRFAPTSSLQVGKEVGLSYLHSTTSISNSPLFTHLKRRHMQSVSYIQRQCFVGASSVGFMVAGDVVMPVMRVGQLLEVREKQLLSRYACGSHFLLQKLLCTTQIRNTFLRSFGIRQMPAAKKGLHYQHYIFIFPTRLYQPDLAGLVH